MTHQRPDALDPATFSRLDALLDGALELEGTERAAFLERECRGDPALRRRVEALLDADTAGDNLLDRPFGDVARRLLDEAPDGQEGGAFAGCRFGPWRALHEIGRGGMGAVWLAERADGVFEQRVAIKVVPAALASRDLRARFEQERRILARLEHPHIARLLDGGVTGEGLPWLAMEYVEGEPVTSWCVEHGAPLAQRLLIFENVAGAVAAAHQRLVVHRDLKPSNILVTASGQPKLLDFGIARLLEPGDPEDGTRTLERRLTPRYAAPEQLRGEPPTTATDVWSLGVLLYQLLSGRHPFGNDAPDLRSLEGEVLERDPPPPSAAFEPGAGVTFAARDVRGDLDHIVMQALRKEPGQRYASAQALLEDVRRHRDGRPVHAVAPSLRYRAAKFLRRNRVPVLAGSLVALALAAGWVTTSWQARIAREQRDRATRMLDFLVGTLANAGPERLTKNLGSVGSADPERPISAVVSEAAARAERELADDPGALGSVDLVLGEVLLAMRRDRTADSVLARAADAFARRGDPIQRHNALHLRSLALRNQSRLAEAESLARAVLAFRRARSGDPVDLAFTLLALESIQVQRRDPAASATLDEVSRLLEGRVPADHPALLEALNSRGILLSSQGRPAAAESLYRRLLPLSERRLGALNPRTITLRLNLGTSLFEQQRWAEAESAYRRVALDRRRVLGGDHLDVTGPLNSLAMTLREAGRLGEAESVFREVIAMRTRLAGPEARETLVSHSGLANVLRLRGRAAEAEVIARRVLAIRRRTLLPGDPLIASSLGSLGESLAAQRRWSEAEAALREALALRESAAPANHREVEKARAALDRLRAARGGNPLPR